MAMNPERERHGYTTWYWGTTYPAAATGTIFQVGDRIFNTAPANAVPDGWVCTTGGDPGIWVKMANLATV